MNRPRERSKPGAAFCTFNPRTTLSSTEPPVFLKSIGTTKASEINAPTIKHHRTPNNRHIERDTQHDRGSHILQDAGTMVNERAPPKAPEEPQKFNYGSQRAREQSPDSDTDISALVGGWASVKSQARDGLAPPGGLGSSSPATNRPTFGHPTKMMSSLKQKANIFIHQKTRPEHHLDNKVGGPRPPAYQNRKAPPLPVFESNDPVVPPVRANYGEEVFYTDPDKAGADLKALLEGGMDEDEEEEGNNNGQTPPATQQSQPSGAEPQEAQTKAETDSSVTIGTDGVVDGLKVRLLPHQVEGVNWMRGRELGPVKKGRVPKGGILADDMGLGKTLQTISLILTHSKPEKDDSGWKKQYGDVEKTTLVVAPLALIRQWEDEIKKRIEKSHKLKVLVHHGPQRTKDPKDLKLYDVVITTYQILISEFGASSERNDAKNDAKKETKMVGCFGLDWWRIVLDEAHTIKNRNAKTTKACYALRSEYRWCLSGTPMQNNLDELQSLIKFLRIRPYDDLKQWKEHIDLPLKNGKGHIAIRRLHSILRCFMKRRTKEILKEEGALNPGGKPSVEGQESSTGFKHTDRKVITVAAELTPAERQFYTRLETRTDQSVKQMMSNKLSYASAFTLLLRLRQACNHPKLVEGKLEKDKDALSTGGSQKSQDVDVDSVADMFAGMGIVTKKCSICGRDLSDVDNEMGREHCHECHEDLAYFNEHETAPKKTKRRMKKTKTKATKAERTVKQTASQKVRRPRNRRAVVDSDDEEDDAEGSWLVPEGERGELKMGKAGGEEDENAEGGGDWIGSEDSSDEEDGNDRSNLSSFVVDNEAAKGEAASDDDGDSLLSVSDLTKQMAKSTLDEKKIMPSQASASETAGSATYSDSETQSDESDSGIDETELYSSDDNSPPTGSQILASAKIRELTKLLHAEAHEHKFIVFSQFTSMLDLVEPFLRKDGFKFTRYDGSMRNDAREESLRRLREDKGTRILLCSLMCGSLGLNLTAATRVIIIEPFWNPFVEEQAIDRVHRLTQTVDVVVYKLTVSQTVEERIIDLQNKKRELAEQTIEGGSKKTNVKLGLKEMIDLFRPGGYYGNTNDYVGESDDHNAALAESRRQQGAMNMLRKKPGVRREESALYGRRW